MTRPTQTPASNSTARKRNDAHQIHFDPSVRDLIERERRAAAVEALTLAADRMPAFHDRDVPEWAITSACEWLRDRADRIERGDA